MVPPAKGTVRYRCREVTEALKQEGFGVLTDI
jgi:hypothetical protein